MQCLRLRSWIFGQKRKTATVSSTCVAAFTNRWDRPRNDLRSCRPELLCTTTYYDDDDYHYCHCHHYHQNYLNLVLLYLLLATFANMATSSSLMDEHLHSSALVSGSLGQCGVRLARLWKHVVGLKHFECSSCIQSPATERH